MNNQSNSAASSISHLGRIFWLGWEFTTLVIMSSEFGSLSALKTHFQKKTKFLQFYKAMLYHRALQNFESENNVILVIPIHTGHLYWQTLEIVILNEDKEKHKDTIGIPILCAEVDNQTAHFGIKNI